MSEWKPGDVAMIGGPGGVWVRAIRQSGQWATENQRYLSDWQVDVRPLVVIDPEDAAEVERLADCLYGGHAGDVTKVVRAALREFARPTPPKPEEPTGLGAVVEDADGKRWVRHALHAINDDYGVVWCNDFTVIAYDDIAAVRVLSPGVEA